MDLTEVSQSSPLFCNSKINRRLSPEAIRTVLETLESKGNVEWQDGKKDRCLVMWRTPQEWGQLIYQWAEDSGLSTSVCTLYEMHSGEDTTDQEFYGMEVWMLKRAIQALSRLGKAELIPGDNPDGSDAGVKFFS
ncbi:vacuolar protein-sorting-associated protein 25-like [Halichondria panicea]